MGNLDSNNHFTTTDTALAAWLYSQGFEFLEVNSDSFPSVLIFSNDNPKLKEYVRKFQCGKAEGDILTFYRAYKKLLGMIKVGRL